MLNVKKKSLFSISQVIEIKKNLPNHIAIIPDGNRRWAKKNNFNYKKGYTIGIHNIQKILQASIELGIKTLTFYGFSTENWKRSEYESKLIMALLKKFLKKNLIKMKEEGISFYCIGDIYKLSPDIIELIKKTKLETKNCKKIQFILALNYGSRDEIRRMVLKIINDTANNKIKKEQITEELISSYLDTNNIQDPDLLIRTSGEQRLSNFLLWQLSYGEVFISKMLWPDFTPNHFYEAILDYQKRKKNLGI